EIAKVMARVLDTNLIRLQCYEGLDAAAALYEWNYQKQLLHIKLHESSGRSTTDEEREIFSEDFLLRRPLLQAISQPDQAPVLDREGHGARPRHQPHPVAVLRGARRRRRALRVELSEAAAAHQAARVVRALHHR